MTEVLTVQWAGMDWLSLPVHDLFFAGNGDPTGVELSDLISNTEYSPLYTDEPDGPYLPIVHGADYDSVSAAWDACQDYLAVFEPSGDVRPLREVIGSSDDLVIIRNPYRDGRDYVLAWHTGLSYFSVSVTTAPSAHVSHVMHHKGMSRPEAESYVTTDEEHTR